MIEKIVSGGQTGVDRAALDAAIQQGVPIGGWCPEGRLADDGPIDNRYPLQEVADTDHTVRTEFNVRDSDGSLMIYRDKLHGGTAYALEMAKRMAKPVMAVNLDDSPDPKELIKWIKQNELKTLHIGGQREDTSPGIYGISLALITQIIEGAR
ncbi:MAG: putative molybdenum carrier protein [Gammaproteobacteria bacterium]